MAHDPGRVLIFDTTLRDGEQSPGASLNLEEKLAIAQQLARLGVDVIEAGFPFASPGDFAAVQRIAQQVGGEHGPVICGLSRASRGDIKACAEAVAPAPRKRIHTFIATSPIHMKAKLRMSPEDVLEKEREIIRAQPDMEGKPAEIVEKMLGGRINKFLKEVSLNDQPFVKDPNTTVGKLVQDAGAEVVAFERLVVGEGIEKEEVDFAAEVMAQAKQ